jgi:hypothetical protein
LAQAPVTLAGTGTLATPTNGREGRGGGGVANILSAARADEKAVAKAASKGIKVAPREIPTEAEGER